jgi:hypothetical protein
MSCISRFGVFIGINNYNMRIIRNWFEFNIDYKILIWKIYNTLLSYNTSKNNSLRRYLNYSQDSLNKEIIILYKYICTRWEYLELNEKELKKLWTL